MKKHCFIPVITIMFVVLFSAALIAGPSEAKYPEKGLTLIVVYGTGGGTDVTARLLASHMEKVIGRPVTVKNVTGGGGWVGWSTLAHAKPDGYTIGYLNIPNIYAGYLDPKMKRPESLESFTPIMNHVTDPCIWAVKADSKFKSLKELVDYAKANPKQKSITAHGYGNDDHLAILWMESLTGAKFNVIHNKSTAISKSQLLGGHVDALGANVSEIFQMAKKGEIRVLGVMGEKRSPFLPDVPTFKEQGYEIVNSVSRGIAGPAGLPDDIAAAIADALEKTVQMKAHQEKATQLGLALDVMKGATYKTFLKDTEQRIKKLMGW
ncbi:MAG: tripartite tricarboxylate transporter substrate binding protein [Deltaproteobacteria bacterium]|nr:tripartite tricarboxylate transporter substrate binding protein [Deltaproteobacteria bacterium]MBW2309119.1 tripartite tricarboxylate transporter substrate binding protein [Deltaproteobacteria bacterium]